MMADGTRAFIAEAKKCLKVDALFVFLEQFGHEKDSRKRGRVHRVQAV